MTMKARFQNTFFLFISFILLQTVFFSCASRPSEACPPIDEAGYIPQTFDWQQVSDGIQRFDFENKAVPIKYHAARIDLDTPGLAIVCFPDKTTVQKKDGTVPAEIQEPFIFTGMRTEQFAKKYNCIVAINATQFSGRFGILPFNTKLGSTRVLVGIHQAEGLTFSSALEQYSALAFVRNTTDGTLRAIVMESQREAAGTKCEFIFGGFFKILSDGKKNSFRTESQNSRSGAGISNGGRFLYLLVVEGEMPFSSKGLSYPQCADVFTAMGCTDALEFDGGSSAQLCINGKSVLSYPFTAVQANSFGFAYRK